METASIPGLEVPEGLFKDVKYYLVGNVAKNIEELLKSGGAKRDHYMSEMITHVIADTDHEDDYNEAKELFELPVVTSKWVILSIKCGALLPTTGFSPESTQIFSGVVACPSQLSSADQKSVWAMLTFNGATCQAQLNSQVTHLITSETTGPKYELCLRRPEVHIVCPDWVSESTAQKQRLPEKIYQPRLLLSETDIKQEVAEPSEESQELDPYGLPLSPPPNTPTTTNLIFKSDSTRTKEVLARMVSNRILQGGKESKDRPLLDPMLLVKNQMNFAPPTDVISPPPPDPAPVISASPRGMGSPRTPRAPRARGVRGSPGRGHLRNITNNTDGRPPRSPRGSGRGRSPGRGNKMSQLVSSLNRPIPPFMQNPLQLPSHLPFGQLPTVPTDLAVYYGHDPSESVPDDVCLIGCVFYITDYHKYLEEQELENWKQVIEQHRGQVDDSYSNRVTHVLCEHQKSDVFQLALRDGKRVVTAHWLNDCLLLKKMQPPWLALHFPSVYATERPCKNQIICVTNFEGEERIRVKHMITVTGARYTGYLTHGNSVVIAKSPVGVKYQKACEWRIPVVNVQWLNDILLGDLQALKLPLHYKFQQFHHEDPFKITERWRVAHLLEGWKIPIKVSKEAWKRFNPSQNMKPAGLPGQSPPSQTQLPPGMTQVPSSLTPPTQFLPQVVSDAPTGQKRKAEGDVEQENQPEKRHRPDDTAAILAENHMNGMDCPVVLLTGIPKKKTETLVRDVKKLGGQVTSTPRQCSHLVVNCIARTIKFFSAIGVVKYVVTPDWVTQSAKAGKFLDEADFLLKDEKAEAQFEFSLQESLRKARERKLFQGLVFYITPTVLPGVKPLQEILENCGGLCITKRLSTRKIAGMVTPEGKPAFIVITCENDLHLCVDLQRRKIDVHNAEFILTGVMRQEVDYEAYRY